MKKSKAKKSTATSKGKSPTAKRTKKKKLTTKQQRLVNALKKDPTNIAKAGREAGFDRKYSSKLVRQNTTIKKIVSDLIYDLEVAVPNKIAIKAHKSLITNKQWQAKAKGLDMYYKIRDKYPRSEADQSSNEPPVVIGAGAKVVIVFNDAKTLIKPTIQST